MRAMFRCPQVLRRGLGSSSQSRVMPRTPLRASPGAQNVPPRGSMCRGRIPREEHGVATPPAPRSAARRLEVDRRPKCPAWPGGAVLPDAGVEKPSEACQAHRFRQLASLGLTVERLRESGGLGVRASLLSALRLGYPFDEPPKAKEAQGFQRSMHPNGHGGQASSSQEAEVRLSS